MADFGKLNFSVAFNPTSAFPLDARYYFSSLDDATAATAAAVEVGSSEGTYHFGENVVVVENDVATLYLIQPDGTLSAVGTETLGDEKSIEVVDGVVQIVGFDTAEAGQQLRIGTGGAVEWFTPDSTTVDGLSSTVAGHTSDIATLQDTKADKATTLEGYGITDAMTATEIASAIDTAIAATGHASFEVAESVPDAADAVEDVMYLVKNATTGYYDIYTLVSGEVVLLDDTSVDLSNYYSKDDIAALLNGKVDVVEGKTLSTNDYTDEDKAKLDSVAEGADVNVIELIQANGSALTITEKAVNIPLATTSAAGLVVSSDAENMVSVDETTGTMEVNSLNINRLVQTDGDTLTLDGGSSVV